MAATDEIVAPYETEKVVQVQYLVMGAQVQQRTITYTTWRGVYRTLSAAKTALADFIAQTGGGTRDGTCRRITPNGWAETNLVTREYGEWGPFPTTPAGGN